MNSQAQDKI
uniref:Uncharacterized protein n=1 Tax=Anguilla anguilla TaxID=7936 RepID=A0A0E9ULK9_ANGAN